MEDTRKFLDELPISKEDKEKIAHGNVNPITHVNMGR